MAVRMQVSPARAGEPGVERVEYQGDELFMETTYVGRVLSRREMNGYDDSDFYAMVWEDATNEPREVMYATTRGWTYANSATVDATDEVRAKYAAWRQAQADEDRRAAEETEASIPRKGAAVEVVRGKHRGKAGVVFWFGVDKYQRRWQVGQAFRVGVETADGEKFFTAAGSESWVLGVKLWHEGNVRVTEAAASAAA